MNMPEKITSDRLILERPYPITFDMAKEIFAAVEASRTTLRLWLPWVETTLRAEDEFSSYLSSYCLNNWNDKKGFPYIIRLQKNNEFIGGIDLMQVDEQCKSGEIGYWLADSAVGFGYMQEAVKCLEKTAFELGLNRIVIRNETENTRSVNVALKCGYHLDGVMRQDRWNNVSQKLVDTNVFSKLKSEFSVQPND